MTVRKWTCPWAIEALAPGHIEHLAAGEERTPAEVDFIVEELGRSGGELIADIGCGLGRHCRELSRRGYRAVGFDLSAPLLCEARRRALDEGVGGTFVRADARDLPLVRWADAALSVCFSGLTEMPCDEDELGVICSLARCLRPGGRLLINTWNPYRALQQEMITDLATMRAAVRYEPPELDHPVTRHVRAFFPSELRLALRQVDVRTDGVYAGGDQWAARRPPGTETADHLAIGTKLEDSRT